MRERTIEAALVRKVKAAGGRAYKFVSPGHRGVPDRLCLFPGGLTKFVEVKAPGGSLSVVQEVEIEMLGALGFECVVVDSMQGVDEFMASIGF